MRRHMWRSILIVLSVGLCSEQTPAQEVVVGTYTLGRFQLESGGWIDNARVVYATYGRLNEAGDNAILLPQCYDCKVRDTEFLIGPARALDASRYFIVSSEMFGSGGSSSPSNTPTPLDGPRFPQVSIRDDVEASRRLLWDHLGVRKLQAVIGFSMGAQQAFQWAVSHPSDVRAIVALCGTAKTYPHGWLRLESVISALRADPRWKGGDYTEVPSDGLRAWAEHWASWMYSQEWWRLGLYRPQHSSPQAFVDAALAYWAKMNLNDAVLLARTWQAHDISVGAAFGGDIERALRSIRVPVLYMPSTTDLYFPITDAEYERSFIPLAKFVPIQSLWGHTAGAGASPEDAVFINREVGAFLGGIATNR